jgi:hypothetical protein
MEFDNGTRIESTMRLWFSSNVNMLNILHFKKKGRSMNSNMVLVGQC